MATTRLLVSIFCSVAFGGWFYWRFFRRKGEIVKPESLLPVMILAGLFCRLIYAYLAPVAQAPDELAHLKYIDYLALNRALPVQTHKWYDPAYDWEYCQAPLYYLLATPFYTIARRLFSGISVAYYVLRTGSVLLWLLNVWLALKFFKRAGITDSLVRNFAIGMVCLLPTYTFTSAAINNDNLLAVIGTALICLMAGRRQTWGESLALGGVLGLALLTKQSAITFVPVIGALFFFEAKSKELSWGKAILQLSAVMGLALAMFSPWLLRNWRIYGTLTPEYNFVEVIKWPLMFSGILSAAHNILKTFWAVSGPANDVGYPFPLAGYIFLFLCLNWHAQPPSDVPADATQPARQKHPDYLQREKNGPLIAALWVALLVNFVLVMRYGYVLGMGQGRHLFPVLLAIAVLLARRWRTFPAPRLEPYTTGIWIAYALSFLIFSMWLIPPPPTISQLPPEALTNMVISPRP